MRIFEIRLFNFRNLQEQRLSLSPQLNLFLGQNGQGKTNLLEAFHFALRGDSFRYTEADSLKKYFAPFARVEAKVSMGGLVYEIKATLENQRKGFFLNGKRVSPRDLRQKFQTVLFSPESLAEVKESAEHRRDLVDQVLEMSSPRHLDLLDDYKKILKTRNRLLRDSQEISEPGAKQMLDRVLESLHPQFLNLATEVTYERLQVLAALQDDFQKYMRVLSADPSVEISVDYLISQHPAQRMTRNAIESLLEQRLQELSSAERSSGSSLVGPQKHEIRFLMNGKDARFYASQGQQRALIISFKLAQIVYHRLLRGNCPVLLLDDVLSELDTGKRSALISFLKGMDAQTFVTSTDLGLNEVFLGGASNFDTEVSWIRGGALTKPCGESSVTSVVAPSSASGRELSSVLTEGFSS